MSNKVDKFLQAQDPVYDNVVRELSTGRKTGHWMWFIFPQLSGLGRSSLSQFYGIKNLQEAKEYLAHPVLGNRLKECCELLLLYGHRSIESILGPVDAVKLRSCMTLFEYADDSEAVFKDVLDTFYNGERDEATLRILKET